LSDCLVLVLVNPRSVYSLVSLLSLCCRCYRVFAPMASIATPPPPSPSPPPSSSSPGPPSPPTPSSSPSSDDSELIEDLSFDYIFDDNGHYVRMSKGPSKSNRESNSSGSPATPEERTFGMTAVQLDNDSAAVKPPSPLPSLAIASAHARRSSLSRSESYSAPSSGASLSLPATGQASSSHSQARSFQRVASVPVTLSTTPGHSASATRAMRPLARRVQAIEDKDQIHQEEKEN
ncbi:unnamed protein product, partial [Mycena citricolor]